MAIGKALAVSFGALAGGAAGFYFLEMYKIKSKEKRLAMLLEKKQEYETSIQKEGRGGEGNTSLESKNRTI